MSASGVGASPTATFARLAVLLLLVVGAVQLLQQPAQNTIAYDRYGSGDPITIAIHGSPGTRKDFALIGPLLEGTVYALDMPGFGESPALAADYGVDAAANAVLDFLNANGLNRVTMLGYSWGGAVAVETAVVAPERVERVVLLDSMGIPEAEPIPFYPLERARYFVSAPFLLVYPGALVLDLASRHGFLRSYIDTDLREVAAHLAELPRPTLIVHGRRDTVVPPWAAERLHALIPNSELRWFDGGHGTIFYDGGVIAEAMK